MHKRRSVLAAVTALLMAMVTLSGCSDSSEDSGSEDGLRVAFTPGFSTLAMHVADTEGIFKKHGLDIDLTEGIDLATYISALDNQYDISMVTSGVFLPAAQRLDVVAVAGMQINVEDPPNSVVMTDDDSIQGPMDLVGKTVGTASITGTSAQALQYLVKEGGGDPNSVRIVQVGFGEQADQLKAGNVDAVISALPFWTGLESAGYRVVFDAAFEAAKTATGADVSLSAFWGATQSYADENADKIEAFRSALTEAVQWITDNETEARGMLVDWLGVDEQTSKNAPLPAVSVDITAEQLEPSIVLMESLETIPPGLKADDVIWTAP